MIRIKDYWRFFLVCVVEISDFENFQTSTSLLHIGIAENRRCLSCATKRTTDDGFYGGKKARQ